ncbi:thioesterase [Xenorhabdus sp. ZM]|uniref:thioesterase II family protein n=1 Tax=Xenorhabdus szentirmaii TaxID=290112 RepID=UPI001991F527|nr:thioesterase domain-containing protein [Xenorhabdus sp. ZM]MBD2806911.1 thioesterase [Xenorhabdus sp. ZM]
MNNNKLTLLCFSYAGGSAEFYLRWQNLLPNIKIIPVEIPGRGRALNLQTLNTRDHLVDYLMKHYAQWCIPPFAFFGHSLGARIALEFLLVLEKQCGIRASQLFISGCLAPIRFTQAMCIYEQNLSDATLLQILAELGGTPPELMTNSALMKSALPVIRADFQLAIDLSKSPITSIFTPIYLLLGNKDKVTNLFKDYPGWAQYTSCECQVSVIDGAHFFIRTQTKLVANLVRHKLKELSLQETKF